LCMLRVLEREVKSPQIARAEQGADPRKRAQVNYLKNKDLCTAIGLPTALYSCYNSLSL
jgi:hypothetical protein